jgi:hypothetical protein
MNTLSIVRETCAVVQLIPRPFSSAETNDRLFGSGSADSEKMLCYSTIQRKRCAEMRKNCTWSGTCLSDEKRQSEASRF